MASSGIKTKCSHNPQLLITPPFQSKDQPLKEYGRRRVYVSINKSYHFTHVNNRPSCLYYTPVSHVKYIYVLPGTWCLRVDAWTHMRENRHSINLIVSQLLFIYSMFRVYKKRKTLHTQDMVQIIKSFYMQQSNL